MHETLERGVHFVSPRGPLPPRGEVLTAFMHPVALCIHVLAVVFGAGQVVAIFVIAASARRGLTSMEAASALVRRLLPLIARGLVALFVSGAILDFATGRVYDRAVWFRVSVLLLLFLGALVGFASRTLRRASAGAAAPALQRVERLAVAMWLVVVAAVLLMELKP